MTKSDRIKRLERENDALTEVFARVISGDEIVAYDFVRTMSNMLIEAEEWAARTHAEAKKRVVFVDDTAQ